MDASDQTLQNYLADALSGFTIVSAPSEIDLASMDMGEGKTVADMVDVANSEIFSFRSSGALLSVIFVLMQKYYEEAGYTPSEVFCDDVMIGYFFATSDHERLPVVILGGGPVFNIMASNPRM